MRTHVGLALMAALMLGIAGCGGSGSGPGGVDPPDPPDPPDTPEVPPGNVTVSVTVRDAFGTPVAGANVLLLRNTSPNSIQLGKTTDANGRVEVKGGLDGVYAAFAAAPDLAGSSYEPNQPSENRITFAVTAHPASADTPGISNVSFLGASANGRQLDFSARLYLVEGGADFPWEGWNIGGVAVLPCMADCIDGDGNSSLAYEGIALSADWIPPGEPGEPIAVALLMDQGTSVNETDPANVRLLAARYFQTRLGAGDSVALAAFAADDADAGAALLPDQPATIYPVDDPAFTTDGSRYFESIEALASLEGGASPLHAAVSELIDFTTGAVPADVRRAVVVLASDGVTDCDTPTDCRALQDALRAQSEASGVTVAAVGLSNPSRPIDRRTLGTLAQSGTGAVFWAQDPTQVPTVFGRIPEILAGRHGAIDVTVQLQSPNSGAFVSGRTVAGSLRIQICPWDCTDSIDVPFAIRIP